MYYSHPNHFQSQSCYILPQMFEALTSGSYVLKSGNIKKELSVELFDTQILIVIHLRKFATSVCFF